MSRSVESIESLSFCGLKKKTAEIYLERYRYAYKYFIEEEEGNGWQPCLLKIIRWNIRNESFDAIHTDSDQEWDTALYGLGIKRSMREGILDQEFRAIRDTKSAKYWALEMVVGSFESLTCTQRTSNSIPETDHKEAAFRQLVRTEEGETPLYKAGFTSFIMGALDYDTIVREWQLPLRRLLTPHNGDFNCFDRALYLTNEWDTIYKHAAYYKRVLHPDVPIAIIQINMPADLMSNPYLLSGTEWQEMVFSSRRDNRSSEVG